MATPFKRDLIGELAHACSDQGLGFGCYLSIADWRHPLYGVGLDPYGKAKTSAAPDAWQEHLKAQAAELLQNYGPLCTLWFDAEWDWCWRHEDGLELYRYCRNLQHNLLINDRVDRSRQGMRGLAQGSIPIDIPLDWLDPLLYSYFRTPRPATDYAGDYRTVENEHADSHDATPWEACLMMGTTWSWNPHGARLEFNEVLDYLMRTTSQGGNLLLNVSPDPDGVIPEYQGDILRQLGGWLRDHPGQLGRRDVT